MAHVLAFFLVCYKQTTKKRKLLTKGITRRKGSFICTPSFNLKTRYKGYVPRKHFSTSNKMANINKVDPAGEWYTSIFFKITEDHLLLIFHVWTPIFFFLKHFWPLNCNYCDIFYVAFSQISNH
jgi:hypothetical protein